MTDALSDFMFAKNISRTELAKVTKLSPATLDRLLAGHGQARRVTRRRLAKALEVNDEEIDKMLKAQRRVLKYDPHVRVLCKAAAVCRYKGKQGSDSAAANCRVELVKLIESFHPQKQLKLVLKKPRKSA